VTAEPRSSRVGREEMDALHGARPRPAQPVESRDFSRPRRLSGERRERVARAVRTALLGLEAQLGNLLRRTVRIELGAIGELSIEGYFATVPDPLAVLAFRAGGHPAWIVWDAPSAVIAVEQVLGAPEPRAQERPLSMLERNVLDRILSIPAERLCVALGLSSSHHSVPAKREQLGTWRDAGERADPHRVSIELLIDVVGTKSSLRVYLPTNEFLESDEHQVPLSPNEKLPLHLDDVTVEVAVRLGHTELPLRDLLGLEVGDVVPIDALASAPVTLHADNRRFALGKLGRRRGRLAVRLSEISTGPQRN